MLLQESQRHYDEIQCNSTKTSIFSLKQKLLEVRMKTCNIQKMLKSSKRRTNTEKAAKC